MSNSSFDPELSAKFHNKIFEHAWSGTGRDVASLPSTSWWEQSSPIPFDLASRLNPNLVRFLRLAKDVTGFYDSGWSFSYYLTGLARKEDLLRFQILESRGDRYVMLYHSTCTTNDEEVGILFVGPNLKASDYYRCSRIFYYGTSTNKSHRFDQKTELAAFFPDWMDMDLQDVYPWRPLQNILYVYLEMINDGKVTTYPAHRKGEWHSPSFPWKAHQYTQSDVKKAVTAFTRLLDAIESRLPSTRLHKAESKVASAVPQNKNAKISYTTSTITSSIIRKDSFVHEFLSALPARDISFDYIAPGIRLQSEPEFLAQPFSPFDDDDTASTARKRGNYRAPPVLLFRGEAYNTMPGPWSGEWCSGRGCAKIPTGLYIEEVSDNTGRDAGNETRLLLPFDVGRNGHTRSSNGVLLNECYDYDEGLSDKLYQVYGISGILPWDSSSSQLHKVLDNWAERVEMGDWTVGEIGVVDGIEKFMDADTPDHWKKYQTSL